MTREIFTPAQAAEYLQISREVVYRLLGAGTIRASKFGGQWRVAKRALDDMLYNDRSGMPSREGTCRTEERVVNSGGSLSTEYDNLLGLKTTKTRRLSKAA